MPSQTPIRAISPGLDEQAISSFAKEVAQSVENTALACIFDHNGEAIWHQRYRSGAPEASDCAPDMTRFGTEPMKRELGRGNVAFDFPLLCNNVKQRVFTIVVYTLDPPSLTAVEFQVGQMLRCITRQIDVDATLTTTRIEAALVPPATSLSDRLDDLRPGRSLASSLQRVVDLYFAECNLECAAVIIPASRTTAIACRDTFSRRSIGSLAVQLQKPLQKQIKVITAPITLADGQQCQVICAPIMRKQKIIDGMALLIARKFESSHSRVVRLVANKVATLLPSDAPQNSLYDRHELVARINSTLNRQPTLPHSFVYFDVDKMHTINDAFGYSGGDRALATFRQIIFENIAAKDLVAHLGSDRFAIFLPGSSGETAVTKATQILQLLTQQSINDDAKSINLSASAGVVDTDAARKGAEDMLVLAEVASRGAQERGGNQCAFFQDVDSSIIQRRSDVDKVGFLQMALLENRFVLHAQRIAAINVDSGQKFELLSRLDDEAGLGTSPAQFLSAAERYQLMGALDRWVIHSALTSIAGAQNTLEVNLATFCINVSAQSLQDPGFIDFVESRIAEGGVPPDILCFEITETSLVRHIDRAQSFVHRLQRLGCLVALDDFGTGYSSFAYLKTLPVNFLKIDGSFVRDLLENDLSKTIVNAVVQIAEVIGAQTVAEHVENPLVQAWLKSAGVHFVQGFSVHRPEPFTAVLEKLDATSGLLTGTHDSIDLRLAIDGSTPRSRRA